MCVHLIAYCMGKKSLKENACNILGQKTMITLQQGKTKLNIHVCIMDVGD